MCESIRVHYAMTLLLLTALACWSATSVRAQEGAGSGGKEPASVSQAAKVLDLREYTVPKEAVETSTQRLAAVHYRMKATPRAAFSQVRKQLTSMGCREPSDGFESDDYCSSMFEKEGFCITVSALPGSEAGEVNVMIDNHGNVSLGELPKPDKSTLQFESPAMVMYQAEVSLDAGKTQIADGMQKAGWTPYGSAGDQMFFRKNAVIVSAFCSINPTSENKSILQYSSQLVSAEIPLPPNATNAQYSDVTQELYFATTDDKAAIRRFYVDALASGDWKPTSDELAEIDFEFVQIFRRDDGRLMRLRIRENAEQKRRDVRMKLMEVEPDKQDN